MYSNFRNMCIYLFAYRRCAGKQKCSLAVNTALFGDPCGYEEFLKVKYQCVRGRFCLQLSIISRSTTLCASYYHSPQGQHFISPIITHLKFKYLMSPIISQLKVKYLMSAIINHLKVKYEDVPVRLHLVSFHFKANI